MRVLIIEDSPIEAKLLRQTLEKILDDPVRISHVETLRTAKNYLLEYGNDLDLVFMDLGLPDSQDWKETYSAVQPYAGHLPIIVMTSRKSKEIIEELLEQGIEDYIVKGSKRQDPEFLKETIEFALLRHKVVNHLAQKIEEQDQCVQWLSGGYSVQ